MIFLIICLFIIIYPIILLLDWKDTRRDKRALSKINTLQAENEKYRHTYDQLEKGIVLGVSVGTIAHVVSGRMNETATEEWNQANQNELIEFLQQNEMIEAAELDSLTQSDVIHDSSSLEDASSLEERGPLLDEQMDEAKNDPIPQPGEDLVTDEYAYHIDRGMGVAVPDFEPIDDSFDHN